MNQTWQQLVAYLPAPVLSFLLTTVGAILAYFLRPRVNLIWGQKNKFLHLVKPKKEGETDITIHTAHYIIQNVGRLPAKNVEVVLNYPPDEISLWNQRSYKLERNHEGRLICIIEFIAAKEAIDLALLTIGGDVPDVLNIKCPEHVGKQVPVGYHRQFPKPFNLLLAVLMFLGFAYIVEKLLKFFLEL
jgi:hypothetical protein